jgi:hypothetical protein
MYGVMFTNVAHLKQQNEKAAIPLQQMHCKKYKIT